MPGDLPPSIQDKTRWIVVTGASRGIGAAIARELHKAGYGIILWSRNTERLQYLANDLSLNAERVRWVSVDVSCPEQVARAATQTLVHGTPVYGVVLNAGIGRWEAFGTLTFENWRQCLDVNLSGAFLTLKTVLPHLDRASAPIVLGILSDSAFTAFPNRSAYASSKSGLQALLDVFRREYRGEGIRVCQVFPSRVDTYFSGSHEVAGPGTRPEGLRAEDVAQIARWIFEIPKNLEVRDLRISSTYASFGLEEECLDYAS